MPKLTIILLGAGLLALSACEGSKSSNSPTPVTPTPPPAVTSVVAQGTISKVEPLEVWEIRFFTSSAGTIQATVDWTSADCDMDVALVRDACTIEQINGRACPYLAFSESTTAKPERLTVPNVQPGTFTLYILSAGPDTDSVSYQVTLTTGAATVSGAMRPMTRPWPKGPVRRLMTQNPHR